MWFTASLLFESVRVNGPPDEPLFEESVVLIQAWTAADAQAEAEAIGRRSEHEYVAADGYVVRWVFREVERICEVLSKTLQSGTEVFYRFLMWEDTERVAKLFEKYKTK